MATDFHLMVSVNLDSIEQNKKVSSLIELTVFRDHGFQLNRLSFTMAILP